MAELELIGNTNIEPGKLWTPSTIRHLGLNAVRSTGLIHTGGEPDQLQILNDLESVVGSELNRHDANRKFWLPRDFMPIDDDGRIIGRAQDLSDEKPLLSETAQAAMILNLLTEDNLPSYHRIIAANFGMDGAWGNWINKWTAEENRHAYVMRAYLDLTEAVDTVELETDRMKQMELGYDDGDKDPLHTIAYVTFQELATRISHRNTGKVCKDPIANKMLQRIAMDENLHMIFYRNLVAAAFELAPNQMMRAVTDEVVNFEMPGANMDGFKSKSLIIADAGIYDYPRHLEEVVMPTLTFWKVFEREDLNGNGEIARQELHNFLTKLTKKADRFSDQRDKGFVKTAIARAIEQETAAK